MSRTNPHKHELAKKNPKDLLQNQRERKKRQHTGERRIGTGGLKKNNSRSDA